MTRRPRLLDLFSGAGGAAMGYRHAGFDIVGIDHIEQPRYPFEFHRADALQFLSEHGREFDASHASPPCQGYSIMHNLPWLKDREYPLLILPVIKILDSIGRPYVIENVMGARYGAKGLQKRGLEAHGLQAGWLCGTMFGLPFYRHRLFATNWLWFAPGHPKHVHRIRPGNSLAGRARDIVFHDGYEHVELSTPALTRWQSGQNGVGIGHARGWRLAAEAMGIDWMKQYELTQAIPPSYTEFIGRQLARFIA